MIQSSFTYYLIQPDNQSSFTFYLIQPDNQSSFTYYMLKPNYHPLIKSLKSEYFPHLQQPGHLIISVVIFSKNEGL